MDTNSTETMNSGQNNGWDSNDRNSKPVDSDRMDNMAADLDEGNCTVVEKGLVRDRRKSNCAKLEEQMRTKKKIEDLWG